jgi:hypothetical protein
MELIEDKPQSEPLELYESFSSEEIEERLELCCCCCGKNHVLP